MISELYHTDTDFEGRDDTARVHLQAYAKIVRRLRCARSLRALGFSSGFFDPTDHRLLARHGTIGFLDCFRARRQTYSSCLSLPLDRSPP